MTIAISAAQCGNSQDMQYLDYLTRIQARFLENAKDSPLFTTDTDGLWDAYVDALPLDERPFHQCHACRHFIERYGNLVTIDAEGRTHSAIWDTDDAYELYKAPTSVMLEMVRTAKITGVFLSSEKTWGQPVTGVWHHLSLKPEASRVYHGLTQTAGQAMAEKREDYKNVTVALADFTLPMLDQAIRLLESDQLYRSEKVLGAAVWLRDLLIARDSKHSTRRANITWRAIATAPAGFCHPRSSMIGTLLEDIKAGKDFDEVSRAFAAKMHPLQYQRPQAAPSAGTIAQAEKVVAQLGAAGSLARRFARPDEVQALWKPKPPQESVSGDGVFSHLKPKGSASSSSMQLPPVTMTWDKFQRTVLPTAEKIEYYAPAHGDYCVLVTAVNPDAPPILQWDREDARNPVSWYVWHNGSPASQYGLSSGVYVDVAAVTLKPSMWGEKPLAHQGDGVLFLLKGARETRNAGAAIFPEILRSEFHGIRSVIEAFSRSSKVEDIEGDHAVGPILTKGSSWNARVRVTTNGQSAIYDLDRWD